jgi:hypothetical protein
MSCLNAVIGSVSDLGTTTNPRRTDGENVLEKEPTYTTRPFASSAWRGSSGRST